MSNKRVNKTNTDNSQKIETLVKTINENSEKSKDITQSKTKEKELINEKFPKNINEYRHLVDTLKVNDKDLEWVLDLRKYSKITKPIEKSTSNPPNFSNNE